MIRVALLSRLHVSKPDMSLNLDNKSINPFKTTLALSIHGNVLKKRRTSWPAHRNMSLNISDIT
jgi:hypothetical protein